MVEVGVCEYQVSRVNVLCWFEHRIGPDMAVIDGGEYQLVVYFYSMCMW